MRGSPLWGSLVHNFPALACFSCACLNVFCRVLSRVVGFEKSMSLRWLPRGLKNIIKIYLPIHILTRWTTPLILMQHCRCDRRYVLMQRDEGCAKVACWRL
jgi:hypothetical protein